MERGVITEVTPPSLLVSRWGYLLFHQFSVASLLNLLVTKAACFIDFIIGETTLEEYYLTVTLKCKDMRTDTVKEPAVVADDYCTACEGFMLSLISIYDS